jgi:hypothetical protein
MISADWETRQTVEGFIDLAEGTIADVINTAQEKHWLWKHTKLPDMLSQALAASRFTGQEDALGLGYSHESDEELDLESSEVEEEEEEDTELMQMTAEFVSWPLATGPGIEYSMATGSVPLISGMGMCLVSGCLDMGLHHGLSCHHNRT